MRMEGCCLPAYLILPLRLLPGCVVVLLVGLVCCQDWDEEELQRLEMIRAQLIAGTTKVVAESREGGPRARAADAAAAAELPGGYVRAVDNVVCVMVMMIRRTTRCCATAATKASPSREG